MPSPRNITLVVLTDRLYLPGTVRLLESFFHHNGRYPCIALSRSPETLADPKLLSLITEQHLIDPAPYVEIRPYKKRHSRRHAETFYKFEAFQDFGYERNLFLDSDLLCLKPTPLLLESNDSPLLAVRDTGFRPTRGYKGHPNEINSGVLSIHKSLLGNPTIAALQKLAREEPGRGGYNAGDQAVINKWIHRNSIPLSFVGPEYNLIKKDYADTAGVDSCRLLHFCDRKPWFPSEKPLLPLETLWHEPNANTSAPETPTLD